MIVARNEQYLAGRLWFAFLPEIVRFAEKKSKEGSSVGLRVNDIRDIIESSPGVKESFPPGVNISEFSVDVFCFLQRFNQLNNRGFSFYLESKEPPEILNKKLREVVQEYKDIVDKMLLVYSTILNGDFDLYKSTLEEQIGVQKVKLKIKYESLVREILEIIKRSAQEKEKEFFILQYKKFLDKNIFDDLLDDLNIDKATDWRRELIHLRTCVFGEIVPLKVRLEIVDLIDREAEKNENLSRLIEAHNGDYSKVVFYLFTMPVSFGQV